MGTGSKPPVEQARSIFDDLGYTLQGNGREFRAERKWRAVRVGATTDPGDLPDGVAEPYYCFVTWDDYADELRDRLRRADPDYEWAIIGVGPDEFDVPDTGADEDVSDTVAGDYEVLGAEGVR